MCVSTEQTFQNSGDPEHVQTKQGHSYYSLLRPLSTPTEPNRLPIWLTDPVHYTRAGAQASSLIPHLSRISYLALDSMNARIISWLHTSTLAMQRIYNGGSVIMTGTEKGSETGLWCVSG